MVMHEVHECVDGRIAQHRMLNWILVLFYTVSSNEKDGVSDCRILGGMVYSMSMEIIGMVSTESTTVSSWEIVI